MFTKEDTQEITKDGYDYFQISKPDFRMIRSRKKYTLESFLEEANKSFWERFGKEPIYTPKEYITRSRETDSYEVIIRNRFSSINQRCIGGKYCNNKSVLKNNQQRSYHKKGITLEMTKQEFYDWMMSVKPIHDAIVANGDRSSINRIDSRKGYSVDNLELITLHKNIEERFGFECRYMTEEELDEKSVCNHTRYINAQRGN